MKIKIPPGAFYTYIWLRDDGTPYYVGKGKGTKFQCKNRAYRKGSPSPELVLIEFHESNDDALLAEQILIATYGRKDQGTGVLRNRTDGGDGPGGWIMSEHQRRFLSAYIKAHPIPRDFAEHGRKISGANNYWYGRKRTFDVEWRAKIAAGNKGKVKSPEERAAISERKRLWWLNHRPTHCKQGHELSGTNVITDKRGYRSCRACRKAWKRQYRLQASLSSLVRTTVPAGSVPA